MREEEKKKVHPIVEQTLSFCHEGYNCLELDDYAVEQIEDLLKEYYGKPELVDAVVALVHLSKVLRDQGSNSASIQILRATVTANKALEELNKKRLKGKN